MIPSPGRQLSRRDRLQLQLRSAARVQQRVLMPETTDTAAAQQHHRCLGFKMEGVVHFPPGPWPACDSMETPSRTPASIARMPHDTGARIQVVSIRLPLLPMSSRPALLQQECKTGLQPLGGSHHRKGRSPDLLLTDGIHHHG